VEGFPVKVIATVICTHLGRFQWRKANK